MAISPQLSQLSRKLAEERHLNFEILRDPGNATAADYGLRFRLSDGLEQLYRQFGLILPEGNGDETWTLPMPATYIIDGAGIVRYARTDPDYTRRPEPEDTLAAVQALAE